MRISDYLKLKNIKLKRFSLVSAKLDKSGDDFHLIPSPAISFWKGELLKAYSVAIKFGFWGIGISFCVTRKDIDIHEK